MRSDTLKCPKPRKTVPCGWQDQCHLCDSNPYYETCRRCGAVYKRQDKMKRSSNWRPHKCKKSLPVNDDEGAFNDEPSIAPFDAAGM